LIERRPLRADIRAEIVGRLERGELAAGDRLNESHLAAELTVSRTPLREALLGLAAQGLLRAEPGRGFSVPPLTAEEVDAASTLLAALEPELIRRLNPVPTDLAVELGNLISRARLGVSDAAQVPGLFGRFTAALVRHADNRQLGAVVQVQSERLARYLLAAVRLGWDPSPSLAALARSAERLRDGDTEQAAALVADWRRELGRSLQTQPSDAI
jgi:DNA-binding GntR family transcriptional regulator